MKALSPDKSANLTFISAIFAQKLPENIQKQPYFDYFLIAPSPHFTNNKDKCNILAVSPMYLPY
jgi:hypothetical protein